MKKIACLLLFAMMASFLVSPTPATASAPPVQKTLTICTSLKSGHQIISKSGKCNERIYESRTWYQKGAAPSGTPGSDLLDLRTCVSKRSNLQIIRKISACNSKTQTTSLWQRPLGPPVAPTITSVAMGILGTATLEISAPKEDGGARVTSYLVTSAPDEFKATYKPDQIKAAKISGLIPGNTYSFTVVAINSKGSSPASISSKPTIAPTIPSAPTITKVVATGTNTAQLTFTAPTNDGGSPITSYVARSNPGGLLTTVYQSASGTINISNLTHSTSYTFTLTASNAAGASPESANSSSITTATPPPPPAPVVAAPAPTPTPTPTPTVIAVAAIAGVTVPVTGATPVTATTAGTGYTGTVSWTSSGGALIGNFAGATTYTATITLTPTSGYTLTGVAANFFTVAGATSVTNSADSGEIIAVFPATLAAPAFTLSSSSETRTVSTVATGFTINSNGGAIASFAISPAAPSGMSFSTSTGAFSGTPSVIASATTYTITATNAAGSTSQTFSFTVTIAAPAFTLSSSSETRTVNHVATGFTVNSTGGAIASFAISATPPGMSFSTSTGALTGAPNTVASATNYTITATNASGSATQTFTLTVTVGIYTVGDTGPGGGKIFYVATTSFACGPTRATMCTYLEAAPSNWNGADPNRLWALSQNQSTDISGIANDSNAYNNALGIGLGYKNSNDIVNQGNDTTTAAGAARAYTGGSKNDWYLPTSAELNLLCQWQGGVAPDATTLCSFTSRNSATYGAQTAGFNGDYYWSSSEVNSTNAWSQRFASNTGSQANINKSNMAHVRPIRAFGP